MQISITYRCLVSNRRGRDSVVDSVQAIGRKRRFNLIRLQPLVRVGKLPLTSRSIWFTCFSTGYEPGKGGGFKTDR